MFCERNTILSEEQEDKDKTDKKGEKDKHEELGKTRARNIVDSQGTRREPR